MRRRRADRGPPECSCALHCRSGQACSAVASGRDDYILGTAIGNPVCRSHVGQLGVRALWPRGFLNGLEGSFHVTKYPE